MVFGLFPVLVSKVAHSSRSSGTVPTCQRVSTIIGRQISELCGPQESILAGPLLIQALSHVRVSGQGFLDPPACKIEHVESEGIGNRCNLRNPSGLQWLLPAWMLKAVGWRVKEGRAAYHD